MIDPFEPVDPDLGISRRTLLRRGAIVAGTVAWATPVVQSFTSPALGTTGSPVPGGRKGISFIAFRFKCNGTEYAAKVEDPGTTPLQCSSIPDQRRSRGLGCGIDPGPGATTDCSRFTITVDEVKEGEATVVTVCFGAGCVFIEGAAKSGNNATDCVPAAPSADYKCATFVGAPL